MTTLQMNAELFRAMSEIAEDEALMAKLLKYVRKLAVKPNKKTLGAIEEARCGKYAGVVDTSSVEAMTKSILG